MFLITKSSHYYPAEGVGDWVAVRETREDAEEFFPKVVRHARQNYYCDYGTVFLIDVRNLRVLDQEGY
jgi:hypothetical protein